MSTNNNDLYWNLYSTIIISFIIFVSFTIVQSLTLLLLQKIAINDVSDVKLLAQSNLGLISFISSIAGALIILFFIKLKTVNVNDYLSLNSPTFKSSYFFLATFVLLVSVMEYVSRKYPDIFANDFALESYKSANSLPLLYFGIVIFGPIFEEMLFRGFLFKGLKESFLGGTGAVIVSSIIFSAIHIQYGIAIIVFLLFPMSILFGYARLKSNSLILPILLHSLNNLITCLITHSEVY